MVRKRSLAPEIFVSIHPSFDSDTLNVKLRKYKSSRHLLFYQTNSNMADYFQEMGWQPLGEGQAPNHLLHFARLFRDYNIFDESLTQNLAPPASKAVIDNLPSVTITESGKNCPVCLKEHSKGETIKKLPCNHTFHNECILPWLSKTNSCPLCRFELATDDEDYEAFRKEKIRAKEREADLEVLHNSMFS